MDRGDAPHDRPTQAAAARVAAGHAEKAFAQTLELRGFHAGAAVLDAQRHVAARRLFAFATPDGPLLAMAAATALLALLWFEGVKWWLGREVRQAPATQRA